MSTEHKTTKANQVGTQDSRYHKGTAVNLPPNIPHRDDKRISVKVHQGEHGHDGSKAIADMAKPKSNNAHKPAVADYHDKGTNGQWEPGDELPDDTGYPSYEK
jgi:hypothetical protein